MIIDTHGHLSAPAELYAYKSKLLASRGYNRRESDRVIPEERLQIETATHLAALDSVGTDIQFISPRPYQLMHSESPFSIVERWVRVNNETVATVCQAEPDRFRAIAALPQGPGEDVSAAVRELERCVLEAGFIGCILNPDPTEGLGHPPGLGERYWYPLYEKLVELQVPALIHAAGSRSPRENYSAKFITEESIAILTLLKSAVFDDFPDLRLVIPHGGGSVPYQIGRWRAAAIRQGRSTYAFDEDLRRLYYDCVLYSKESIEYLIRTVGVDRVLFGTENPGTGSSLDTETGRYLDDLRPAIDGIGWLSEDDRAAIFESNARHIYPRLS